MARRDRYAGGLGGLLEEEDTDRVGSADENSLPGVQLELIKQLRSVATAHKVRSLRSSSRGDLDAGALAAIT